MKEIIEKINDLLTEEDLDIFRDCIKELNLHLEALLYAIGDKNSEQYEKTERLFNFSQKLFDVVKDYECKYDYKVVEYISENNNISIKEINEIAKKYNLDINKIKIVYDTEYFDEDTFYLCEAEDEVTPSEMYCITKYSYFFNDLSDCEKEEDYYIKEGIIRRIESGNDLIIKNLWGCNKKAIVFDVNK